MDSRQLDRALLGNPITRQYHRGVFPADKISKLDPLPGCCIINTDVSSKDGSHWIAAFQEQADHVETFDSFGKSFSFYKINYFDLYRVVKQTHQLQADTSTVCGQYCLFFLLRRCSGEKYKDIVHLFTENQHSNDEMVCQYVNHAFDLNTKVQDISFIGQRAKTILDLK